eukprot:jgi/Phyca11/20650/fgenesh1_pg.PHYCAscaffold_70_\
MACGVSSKPQDGRQNHLEASIIGFATCSLVDRQVGKRVKTIFLEKKLFCSISWLELVSKWTATVNYLMVVVSVPVVMTASWSVMMAAKVPVLVLMVAMNFVLVVVSVPVLMAASWSVMMAAKVPVLVVMNMYVWLWRWMVVVCVPVVITASWSVMMAAKVPVLVLVVAMNFVLVVVCVPVVITASWSVMMAAKVPVLVVMNMSVVVAA